MNNFPSPVIWKALVLTQVLLFVGETFWCFFPIPYWDAIDWILSYLRNGAAAVFAPHNEHRLPIPRLLIGLDIDLCGGLLWPVSAVALSAAFVLAVLIGRATIAAAKQFDAAAVTPGCALVVSLLLRGYTIPDYVTPTNIQFPIGLAFSALALATLASRSGSLAAASALALALAATGCGAGGLAVLPVLAWLAWRVHGDVATTLMFGAATVIIPVLYIRGMSVASPTDLTWSRLPLFLAEYFGVPWTRLSATLPLAWVQGGVVVATLTILILFKIVRGPLTPSTAFLLGLAATVLAVALMTSVGRASAVDLHTQGSRYGIYAATAQAVFLALLWPWIWARVRHWREGWRALAFIAVAGLLITEQVVSGVAVHHRTVEIADAARNLCGGSVAPSDLAQIYPLPDRALNFIHEIESRKLYCFR